VISSEDPARVEGHVDPAPVADPDWPDRPLDGPVVHAWEPDRGLIRVEEVTTAPPTVVDAAIETLQHHMDWAGERHNAALQHVVALRGPPTLTVGDEFTTKQRTKKGHWLDRSVVVAATSSRLLGFDTQGVHLTDEGERSARGRWRHRYRLEETAGGGTRIRFSCRWRLTLGRVDVYSAAIIATNVHQGILNLVGLSEELAA
jgi:hypothetical protein